MADNVTITPGTGATVSADDIGSGVLVQRVKATWGPDGTANDADVATGKPLPVQLRASTGQALADTTGLLISTTQVATLVTSAQVIATPGAQVVTLPTDVPVPAAGTVAHDGADTGNPLKIGARARSSEIAAVANNDRSDLLTDLVGKLLVLPYSNPENFVSGTTAAMTGTTTTSLIAAPASGLRNYITQITVSNSHATVGTDVLIQDGSGGTTLYVIPAAAVYGGAVLTFPAPLRQPTTATAIFCANVTTGASTKVSASGYKGA